MGGQYDVYNLYTMQRFSNTGALTGLSYEHPSYMRREVLIQEARFETGVRPCIDGYTCESPAFTW